jgi:sialic acid synthase SpsE
MGDGLKAPTASEAAMINAVRRSLHANRDLPPGHVLDASDLVALRPAGGIPPADQEKVIGRPVTRSIPAGDMLSYEDLA